MLRAYALGSWVWVGRYVLRILVFLPLWATGQILALGLARLALSWPLIAATLAVSWWTMRRALPDTHPGLRHPRNWYDTVSTDLFADGGAGSSTSTVDQP